MIKSHGSTGGRIFKLAFGLALGVYGLVLVKSSFRKSAFDLTYHFEDDELIIETSMDASLEAICEQMGKTPPWIPGLLLRADGYETMFYKKLKKWQHPVPWVLPYFYSSEINSAASSLAFFILWIAVLFLSPNAFCTASVLPPS